MAIEPEKVKTDRRGVLKFAGLGTVASGAAIVSGGSAQAEEIDTVSGDARYKETDHVQTFYQSARF